MISLATSLVNLRVRNNITKALDDNRLGSGEFISLFEERVASYMPSRHAVAVSNGTLADIVGLAALKTKKPLKTEVIVPALTFIAQTNSVLINGLTPVFVDIGDDFQIDANKIEEKITDKTLAIFPVHLLGKKCNMKKIMDLARKYDLYVIEDCCEAFGIKGGGDIQTYSFFPSHTITTGEGGMVCTDNDELAELVRSLSNHGRYSDDILDKFHFKYVGFNAKMSNITAAIGAAIVDTADGVISKRKKNVFLLNELTGNEWYAESPHCYPLLSFKRDEDMKRLWDKGIECRKLFSCLPQEKAYRFLNIKERFPVAEEVTQTGYFLPIHQGLTHEDIIFMADNL
jgi:perosamine synthetase